MPVRRKDMARKGDYSFIGHPTLTATSIRLPACQPKMLTRLPILPIVAILLFFVSAGCDSNNSISPEDILGQLPISVPQGFSADIFIDGLDLPTSLAFAPDGSGRLFVNELQTGRIRVFNGDTEQSAPFAEILTNVEGGFPVSGENGLIGLAFDPNYTQNRLVYVSYAVRSSGETFGAVARYRDVDGRGEDFTVLLDSVRAAPGHQIESLAFGPNGKLYVSTGDAFRPDEAADTSSVLGKVLRLNPDGSIPTDNPFPGSYAFALGLRNSFDLAFDDAGNLFAADNGPDHDDELNRIVRGANYGWPAFLGMVGQPGMTDPLFTWPQIVSPDGMAFYRGTQFPDAFRGKLFLVLFGDTFSSGPSPLAKRIQTVDLSASPPVFEDFAVYGFPGTGNPLDVAVGPDGSLYFTDIFQGRVYRIQYQG